MKKSITTIWLILFASWVLVYVLGSFVATSFSITQWSVFGRGVSATAAGTFAVVALICTAIVAIEA